MKSDRADLIAACPDCDDKGIAQSRVTGARGRCRHPVVHRHRMNGDIALNDQCEPCHNGVSDGPVVWCGGSLMPE